MTDVHDSPAVPDQATGGDERLGLFLAGAVLLALGWGLAVAVNLLLHWMAPTGGWVVGPSRITDRFGSYSLWTVAFGLFTGAVGVVLLWLGRRTAEGPFVLPGVSY